MQITLLVALGAACPAAAQSSDSWYRYDIGAPPPAGTATVNGTVVTLAGAGVGVGGDDLNYPGSRDPYTGQIDPRDPAYLEPGVSDEFSYYFRDGSGSDQEIVARITSLSGPTGSQAGVMIREKTDRSALNVALFAVNGSDPVTSTRVDVLSPNHQNGTPGRTYFFKTGVSAQLPTWVKLVRVTSGVMSFTSVDGLTWTPQHWTSLTLASRGYIGLVTSGHQRDASATATFDNVRIGAPTAPIPAPSVPTDLIAVVRSDSVALTWKADASGYERTEIERSTAGGPFVLLTSPYDYDITIGTTYTYRVRSMRGGSYSAYSNTVTVTAGAATTPPTDLVAVATTDRQIDLQWTDTSPNETGFQIERWANSIYYYNDTVKIVTLPANTTAYSDTTVSPSTQYVYRVSALAGQVLSGPSNLIVATTAALSPAGRPTITEQPVAQAALPGTTISLTTRTTAASPAYQWQLNGLNLLGATSPTLQIDSLQPAQSGIYTAVITDAGMPPAYTNAAAVSVRASTKITGSGSEVGSDIRHPNGNVYDQVLLQGASVAVMADPGQVTRVSYIDLSDNIVQVEFAGAGTLTLTLDNPSGPAPAQRYNQPTVSYMKGHANIVITGANETTYVSVFSVGPANAVNASLFQGVSPTDGMADLAFIAISSTNGRFGGVFAGNANFTATRGMTGIYAPNVAFEGPLYVADITAFDSATPVLQVGSVTDARVTGYAFLQPNAHAIKVSGIANLRFTAGTDSLGQTHSVAGNLGRFEENGVDVTSRIVNGQ